MALSFGAVIVSIFNGTSAFAGAIGNCWTYFEIAEWYQLLVMVCILWWLDSVARRGQTQGEIKVFVEDLTILTNIMSYFLALFSFVINTIVDYTFRLFDALT